VCSSFDIFRKGFDRGSSDEITRLERYILAEQGSIHWLVRPISQDHGAEARSVRAGGLRCLLPCDVSFLGLQQIWI
jgi:hypothetical protein